MKLFVALLFALGLAFSSVTASAAVTPNGGMAGCNMGKDMPRMPADHSKMDCCTPACQTPSPSALLPSRDPAPEASILALLDFAWAPVKELASLASSGLDPPPRA